MGEQEGEVLEEAGREAADLLELLASLRVFATCLEDSEAWDDVDSDHDLDPDALAALGVGGVGDDGWELLAYARDAEVAVSVDEAGRPELSLRVDRGLVRTPFPPAGRPPFRIQLGSLPTLLVFHTPPPVEPSDPDLLLALESFRLERIQHASECVARYREGCGPGLAQRLAEETIDALKRLSVARRKAGGAAVGVVRAPFTWRNSSGSLAIQAFPPFASAADVAQELEAIHPQLIQALQAGAKLGWELAAQHLGRDELVGEPPLVALDLELLAAGMRGSEEALGLAAALASYSRVFNLPVPDDLHAAGTLTDAGVGAVEREALIAQLGAIARERPGARVILAQEQATELTTIADDLELIGVVGLEEAVRTACGLGKPREVEEPWLLLDEAFRDERAYRREDALQKARRAFAVEKAGDQELLRARWLEGMCLVHLGRPTEAHEPFAHAWELVDLLRERGQLEHEDVIYLALGQADGHTDTFEYERALSVLERARSLTTGSPKLRAKIDGFLGLVRIHAGRADEAEPVLRRALGTQLRLDRPRFHCWLALALAELGRCTDAALEVERGLALAQLLQGPAQAANRAYLLRARAIVELSRSNPAAAQDAAETGLAIAREAQLTYPASSLIRLRGAALIARGELDAGLEALAEAEVHTSPSPFMALVHGLAQFEAVRALLEFRPKDPSLGERISRVEALIRAYGPAAERFSGELRRLSGEPSGALRAVRRVLSELRY